MEEPQQPQEPQLPEPISFSEAEAGMMVEYINFVTDQIEGSIPLNKVKEFYKLQISMVALAKKIEAHIMEFKRSYPAKKAD